MNEKRENRRVVTQLPPRGLHDEVLQSPNGLGATGIGRCADHSVDFIDAHRLSRTPMPLLDEPVGVEHEAIASRQKALSRAGLRVAGREA